MTYDFTSHIDRRGCDALAVDALGLPSFPGAPKDGFDAIPMWVADMNFPTAPAIVEALQKRAAHPLYGYFLAPDGYYDAIINWHAARNGVTGLGKEHIGHQNGVLGGVLSALRVLAPQCGKVLLHSPTYIGFTSSLENAGYRIIHSPLQRDDAGVWRMDLADMEEKFRTQHIHVLLLCSPHNPTGRVWERQELEAVAALCEKYDVYVISDEIWSDIILTGRHIPTQSIAALRQRTIALYAPSKTFNLAGLVGSYHVVYNDRLRHALERESSLSHYNNANVLSVHALMAGYGQGGAWVDELCGAIRANVDYACTFIADHFPGVSVARPQGTYMLFLDCTDWCARSGVSLDALIRRGWDVGVVWQDGRPFHGPCHIRMNLALPLDRVQEAFRRLKEYVFV